MPLHRIEQSERVRQRAQRGDSDDRVRVAALAEMHNFVGHEDASVDARLRFDLVPEDRHILAGDHFDSPPRDVP